MRDYYLPPFKAAIDAGAASIMVNTSSVNGVPLHASKYWLTDVLKKELGFKGIVVTDWFDIVFLQIYHKTAVTYREAVKQAINAGNDLNMAPFNYEEFCTTLISLVMKGEVKMERINDAVTRILRVKFATGLFDNAFTEKQAVKNFNSTTYKQFALQAAHESIILLKNGDSASKTVGLLPLSKKEKYLVIGPTANSKKVLHGSWSYAWQGNVEELYPATTLTLAQALQEKIGKENIICNSSSNFFDAFNYDASFIEHHKNEVDKIILCLGEQAYAEFIGNIPDLTLPDDQLALAEAAIKTGKPVILILLEGRPRIIRKIEPHIESIVLGMRPGSEGGSAIADVLFGDYNPDGKLSITYPKYPNDLSNYDVPWTMARYQQVQYPFGHGLSYTNFMVGNIELSDTILKANQTLQIFIPVTNSGKQSGKIAIDLFVSDVAASEIPAGKRLKRFTKIELQPGETKKIQFNLTAKDVSFVNTELQTVTEPGDFEIMVADKKAIFHFKQ